MTRETRRSWPVGTTRSALGFPSKTSAEIAPNRRKRPEAIFVELLGRTRKPSSALKLSNIDDIFRPPLEREDLIPPPGTNR
jgi:hypothetical protein